MLFGYIVGGNINCLLVRDRIRLLVFYARMCIARYCYRKLPVRLSVCLRRCYIVIV